jgi:hypothetical protein
MVFAAPFEYSQQRGGCDRFYAFSATTQPGNWRSNVNRSSKPVAEEHPHGRWHHYIQGKTVLASRSLELKSFQYTCAVNAAKPGDRASGSAGITLE